MMSLAVEDADAWWEQIQRIELAKKYPGILCKPPQMQPWGIRVLYLSDPTGVLWHITDLRKACWATSGQAAQAIKNKRTGRLHATGGY